MFQRKRCLGPVVLLGLMAVFACGPSDEVVALQEELTALQEDVQEIESAREKIAGLVEKGKQAGVLMEKVGEIAGRLERGAKVGNLKEKIPKGPPSRMESLLGDDQMEENLLAIASSRDEWFLSQDIQYQSLYDSWSIICRQDVSITDYRFLLEEIRKGFFPEYHSGWMDKVERDYVITEWILPWAKVTQTWALDERTIHGPEESVYLIESGEWHQHDC